MRPFELRGARTREPWAFAAAIYPLETFDDAAYALLLGHDFFPDEELERVSGRRIVGYHERVRARFATANERETLQLDDSAAVLDVSRTARTTTTRSRGSTVAALADRFEVDYLIDA